jgi:hypothetical protein
VGSQRRGCAQSRGKRTTLLSRPRVRDQARPESECNYHAIVGLARPSIGSARGMSDHKIGMCRASRHSGSR